MSLLKNKVHVSNLMVFSRNLWVTCASENNVLESFIPALEFYSKVGKYVERIQLPSKHCRILFRKLLVPFL